MFPSVLGDEGTGIEGEVGSGVTSVEPGDRVIPLLLAGKTQIQSRSA